jgi:hypothetical protein
VFLPNITPARVLFSSEIFPWAFLYSIRPDIKIPKTYLYFFLYLLANLVLISGLVGGFFVSARALFALLNASFIFIVIQSISTVQFEQLKRALLFVFVLNIVVGIVQYAGLFPEFLADFLRLFIDRIQTEADLRGVSGLFAEPAYLSYAMHSFFVYFLYRKQIKVASREGAYALILMALFDILVVRSLTDIVLLSIILISAQKRSNIIKIAFAVCLIFMILLFYFKNHSNPPRSMVAILDFFENQHYKDPMPWLLDVSGFRLASVWGSYRYGLIHPFGSGLGNWGNASIDAIDGIGIDLSGLSYFVSQFGIDYTGVRPPSFGADLMLETGIFGFIMFVWVMHPFIFSKRLFQDNLTRPVLALFIFNCFFLGTIGDPIPFITFGIICREKQLLFQSEFINFSKPNV